MQHLLAVLCALVLAVSVSVTLWVGAHLFTAPPVVRAKESPEVRFPDPFAVRPQRLPELRSARLQGRALEASVEPAPRLALRGKVGAHLLPCRIVLLRRSSTHRAPKGPIAREARLTSDGSYEFTDLVPGDYDLRMLPLGARLRPGSPVERLRLERSETFDFGSEQGLGSLQLRVLGPTGAPLVRTLVALRGQPRAEGVSPTHLLAWGRTDAKGELRLDGLPREKLQYSVWYTPEEGTGDTIEVRGAIDARASSEVQEIRIDR